jgi:hypothetical protein
MRGVRGAITIDEDSADAIWQGARELLNALIEANGIEEEHVASVGLSLKKKRCWCACLLGTDRCQAVVALFIVIAFPLETGTC